MSQGGDGIWRPDRRFDDPRVLSEALERRVLPLVNRPARYVGGEDGAVPGDRWRSDGVNVLLCFPDAYEVGMSHTGLRVLYSLLADRADTFCDLAFAPWPDMEAAMRAEGLPLFGLQSRRPAASFDVIGFSVGYELAYTNVLTMLHLSGLALRARDRVPGGPLVVAGGSCTMNPSVCGPFCDLMLPGDGEEALDDLVSVVARARTAGVGREALLAAARAIPGAWWEGVATPVAARVVQDLNRLPAPRPLVAITEPVHDRLAVEVMRGCARGCRFCQAGMIQRPVRERDVAAVVRQARDASQAAGYAEVGLLSLSTGDYTGLGPAVAGIQDGLAGTRTNLVLPSLRMDSLDGDLLDRVGRERPASVTFAPEAGTQRLRDVINKQITEAEIVDAARVAFKRGIGRVKLYFMIGLPTETNDDLDGIVALVGQLVALAPRGGSQITVSVSPFAPKAHTPFQWAGQIPREEIERRNQYLAKRLRRFNVKVSLRDPDVSVLEAVLGLGDERLADVVEEAWRQGARLDAWDEWFAADRWWRAMRTCGVDPVAVVAPRDPEAPLPWRLVQGPVDDDYHRREWARALAGEPTPDCRLDGPCEGCAACGDGFAHVIADLEPDVPAPMPEPAAPAAAPSTPAADEDPRWARWRERASAKIWCRLEFAKRDRLVFLGHLDFQRLLHQALRRSGLPVAYSKGYHPHPLVKYGPPLPVGVAGEREVLDLAFEWIEPGWEPRLRAVLPAGLELIRAITVGSIAPPSIDALAERFDYRVVLPVEGGPDRRVADAAVSAFLAATTWPWNRQRQGKPDKVVDARRLVPEDGLAWLADDPLTLRVSLLRLEGAGLPVHDFLAALFGADLPEPRWCAVSRLAITGPDEAGRWLSPFAEIEAMRQRVWMQARLND
ncbi:MAG: TIGR03936 family radical SAM-associated protein [Candidatus Krumholzibacteriia bacterium]